MSATINIDAMRTEDFFEFNKGLEDDSDEVYEYLNRMTDISVEELESLNVRQFFALVGAISNRFTDEIKQPSYDVNSVAMNIDNWRVKDYRKYTKAMQEQDFETVYLKLGEILSKTPDEIKKMPFPRLTSLLIC